MRMAVRPSVGRFSGWPPDNLTCLIQEQETLGIAPVFWDDEDEQGEENGEAPMILSMVKAQRI